MAAQKDRQNRTARRARLPSSHFPRPGRAELGLSLRGKREKGRTRREIEGRERGEVDVRRARGGVVVKSAELTRTGRSPRGFVSRSDVGWLSGLSRTCLPTGRGRTCSTCGATWGRLALPGCSGVEAAPPSHFFLASCFPSFEGEAVEWSGLATVARSLLGGVGRSASPPVTR